MKTSSFRIHSLFRSSTHSMAKQIHSELQLLKGIGVDGDCHSGECVQHLSRVAKNPSAPNLRQVHLMTLEHIQHLQSLGFELQPGRMGENICTQGIDLLTLPTGTRLQLGEEAIIEITGLRNPCHQLDKIQQGLMQANLEKDQKGELIRKAGVMAIVIEGGTLKQRDEIQIEFPQKPFKSLKPV